MSNVEIIRIVVLSLIVSTSSTLIATVIGIVSAIPIALNKFKIKKYIIRISETLMSTPPVLMGLLVYILLSRKGLLGRFELLYTTSAMIIAQTLLVLPIIFALTISAISSRAEEIRKTCISLGIKKNLNLIIIKECKAQLLLAVGAGFGIAISEVGAVVMVGKYKRKNTNNDNLYSVRDW